MLLLGSTAWSQDTCCRKITTWRWLIQRVEAGRIDSLLLIEKEFQSQKQDSILHIKDNIITGFSTVLNARTGELNVALATGAELQKKVDRKNKKLKISGAIITALIGAFILK